ncbi:hypothetical protein O59_000072 [Cellvibrio sp. BR]|uniref:hypothetical protein n=1 Tax=Cellvibrio sp. BR TaxID=1134474 RepID=UPI0002601088|nr:hypothetical protein [Cellvibrio sp. BR]EIK46051.1 hypothetical protein O59_000072 [Cellvibrio sp. BR]
MGPITIFDKSFLQSLSIDESVWFDNFYLVNISPLFYIETLADLAKEMSKGRTPDQIVGEIASKTPEMGGSPNVHHMDLLINNLLGQKIVMDGRPILAGGKPVTSGEKKGVAFGVSPEAKAFSRWQNREYMEIERDFAKQWRAQVKAMTFENSQSYAEKLGVDITQCKNINDAYTAANSLVKSNSKPYDLIEFILTSFAIPRELHRQIVQRYQVSGFPPLTSYAPYVAHVIKVEVFFHICVSRGFISPDRPSNKIDIAYLHYLPFCKLFVSGDNLHKRAAPLFLKKDQLFVWGPDLKADLTALNKLYMNLPQEIKDKGILSFASKPPTDGDFLTSQLWDLMGTGWRKPKEIELPLSQESNDKLLDQVKSFREVPANNRDYADFDIDKLDSVSLQRFITKKKGSWFQVPKDLKND